MNDSKKNESTGKEPYGLGALLIGDEAVASGDLDSSSEINCGSSGEEH